jgi:hypothetical protein
MSVVLLNIRELFKKQRIFLVLLIIVQILSAFCLTFIIGVIINNQLYSGMDYVSDYFYISFTGNVKYDEIEGTVTDIFDDVIKSAAHSLRIHAYYDTDDYKSLTIWTDVSIKDGHYVYGPYLNEILDAQLVSGRKPTEEELNSEDCVAVACGISEEKVTIGNEIYEIIGERESSDGTVESVFVAPKKLYDFPLSDLKIRLNRYLIQNEIDIITEKLDEVIPGRYEISSTGESDNEEDLKAVFRALVLSCILIAFVLVGTMTIIYQHILDKRKYKLAVFRLTGCSAWKCIKYYMMEMSVISIPSLICGFLIFFVAQKLKLNNVYPYMELYIKYNVYIELFVGMLIFLNVFMLILLITKLFCPIKKQLIDSKI